ncbi:MAG: DUF3990 domain-containing protein [Ruminococcus sp.]|nr:DUF3990 domain-containing protein [Ruminococcus sp.]
MLLYHTSDIEIRRPDIHFGRKNADFGWGFYLSPDREFTYRWARENAVVNEYELDLSGLEVRGFSRDIDWFMYIFNNRRGCDSLSADVIKGPIANDTIFDTLGIISSGFLKPEDALALLMIGPEYTQVALKTQRAADNLRWLGSERISRAGGEQLKSEQESYREAFLAELERIVE